MFYRIQAAGVLFLLTLAFVFGNASFAQCLCTGRVALAPLPGEGCEACCEHHGESASGEHHGESASGEHHGESASGEDAGEAGDEAPGSRPCRNGDCWVLFHLESTEPQALSVEKAPSLALPPPAFAAEDLPAPRPAFAAAPRTDHPPGPARVPLPVLYSSFLL